MKIRVILLALLIICSLILGVGLYKPSEDTSLEKTPTPTKLTRKRSTTAFWETANVPDPDEILPINAINPEDLGIKGSTEPIDHPRILSEAIDQNELPKIQSTTLSWFESDPIAARNWLAQQETFSDLQPAISYIAHKLADTCDLNNAIEWSKLLSPGYLRDDTIFAIHALALRNGKITPEKINLNLIPDDRREELLSGAAGD